jgi:fused signal recognition particle receptor
VAHRFSRLTSALGKTREAIARGIRTALGRDRSLSEAGLETLEEVLIAADVGAETAEHLVAILRAEGGRPSDGRGEFVAEVLAAEVERILQAAAREDSPAGTRPHVVMVVGVNGVGKTTTIGKLARRYGSRGKTVIVAAADTFRAAAGEQLSVWAARAGAGLIGGERGGDPAAVAFDALEAAIARSADVLIVDTAGRLHTQKNLLEELKKIKRVLGKRLPGAPHDVLLVLDANTGQNALSQARIFHDALGVTGIALAKLDGTAKGGIVVAIAKELSLPVCYVGVGEGVDDLEDFDAAAFARGLVGSPEVESQPEGQAVDAA